MTSICDNCRESSYCDGKQRKYYDLKDGTAYEACPSRNISIRVK